MIEKKLKIAVLSSKSGIGKIDTTLGDTNE